MRCPVFQSHRGDKPSRRQRKGNADGWFLVQLSLVLGALGLWTDAEALGGRGVVLGALGLAFGLSAALVGREVMPALRTATWTHGLAAACLLGGVAVHPGVGGEGLALLAACAAASGLSALGWVMVRRVGPVADVLGATVDGPIRELRGVQFALTPGRVQVAPGGGFDVVLTAQNCHDAPREVHFALVLSPQVAPGREPLRWPGELTLRLAPLEVASLQVGVFAVPGAVGQHALAVHPRVTGTGGARRRGRRADAFRARVPVVMDMLAVFGGLGLGTEDRGVVVDVLAGAPSSPPRFTAEVTSLWRPEAPGAL